MTITICGSCIAFGSCSMCDTPTGFSFDGDIKAGSGFNLIPTHAQGESRGYITGGYSSPINRCAITRFAFSSDLEPRAFVGCLASGSGGSEGGAGASSSTHGYVAGGRRDFPPGGYGSGIQKFPFASDSANATCIGDLNNGRCEMAGNMSTTTGYSGGGRAPDINVIDKYPFASDTNASDSGDLLNTVARAVGHSSRTHGYFSGGVSPPSNATTIQKFSFASEGNTADVAELADEHSKGAGQNSAENGYHSTGTNAAQNSCVDTIDKFPFAADNPGTDIGDISCCRCGAAGMSSFTDGYAASGNPGRNNVIDKFPFASDAAATCIAGPQFQVEGGAGNQC